MSFTQFTLNILIWICFSRNTYVLERVAKFILFFVLLRTTSQVRTHHFSTVQCQCIFEWNHIMVKSYHGKDTLIVFMNSNIIKNAHFLEFLINAKHSFGKLFCCFHISSCLFWLKLINLQLIYIFYLLHLHKEDFVE